jgi:hypothetical protein
VDQTPPACATTCASDGECDEAAHCDLATCSPDLSNGSTCDEDSDCTSGHCQNGHCCLRGDCCADAGDCAFGTYGIPSICDSAATCQGQRTDPACVDSECEVGDLVDDDSGCAGLTSNTCGPYPAVSCTAGAAQSPDQAALCDSDCTGDLECDPGAHCSGGVCVADGEAGDPCILTTECGAGLQCVDNVCCTSSCTGTCRACDVAGHEGTCWNVGVGDDPDGECDGFDCSGYYWGWSGDECWDRADPADGDVGCDGGGRCQGQAAICPAMGPGSRRLTCNSLCQDPTGGTCAGTTAGTCTNVTPTPATETCGVGACQRTVNRCIAGVPNPCTAGSPTGEVCDNEDDDCNGTVDDNIAAASDSYANTCATASWIGNIAEDATAHLINATIYPDGDEDHFRFRAVEGTHTCFPGTGQTYYVEVSVQPPTGVDCRDYDIYLYDDGCTQLRSAAAAGCVEDTISYSWGGTCALDDSRYFRVRVDGWGSAWECALYELSIRMW